MKQRKSFWEAVTDAADLKDEPGPKQPLVEIAADRRVLIENHQGVLAYAQEEIRVKVKFGQIIICGNCLSLSRMSTEQLLVAGNICSVQLCRKGM